jgi:hypothetical protein
MEELASRSTLAHIMNVTIEWRHKCLTVGGEEEGHCNCSVGVIHGGIPHGRACPLAGDAHSGNPYHWPEGGGGVLELWPRWSTGGGGSQYPPGGGGGQYLARGDVGGHVELCLAIGDPPHSITSVRLV